MKLTSFYLIAGGEFMTLARLVYLNHILLSPNSALLSKLHFSYKS